MFQQLVNNVAANAEKLINQLTSIIGQLLTSSIYLFSLVPSITRYDFYIISYFFIARDREKIIKKITDILPTRLGIFLNLLIRNRNSSSWFYQGSVSLMLITFTDPVRVTFLGYEFALIIALLVSFVDALPVLGQGAVFVPWIIRDSQQKYSQCL